MRLVIVEKKLLDAFKLLRASDVSRAVGTYNMNLTKDYIVDDPVPMVREMYRRNDAGIGTLLTIVYKENDVDNAKIVSPFKNRYLNQTYMGYLIDYANLLGVDEFKEALVEIDEKYNQWKKAIVDLRDEFRKFLKVDSAIELWGSRTTSLLINDRERVNGLIRISKKIGGMDNVRAISDSIHFNMGRPTIKMSMYGDIISSDPERIDVVCKTLTAAAVEFNLIDNSIVEFFDIK